ncbi:MAG: hypothetical protein KDD41_11490 [Flavobacteriales bacterium]|nr:hypothetical protein [Flavobacteriales bacterium]
MELHGKIHRLPGLAKLLIGCFVITLSFGYFTGLLFIRENTQMTVQGVEEHYLGNEQDEDAEIMKFRKSDKEIITTIHNHVISMSLIFLALGAILLTTSLNSKLKKVLIVEPFVSILLTFGGIWLLWEGVLWFKYIVMISGMALTVTFALSVLLILVQLFKRST